MTDTATPARSDQQPNTAALPPELFRRWVHSREEDRDDVQVFRTEHFAFPPSFGRDGMELHPDGTFVQHDLGPADGTVAVPGRWARESALRIAVRFDGPRDDYDFTIDSVDADQLRIRPDTATTTRTGGGGWVPAGRNRIRAFRAGRYVLVVAEGDLPTPGYDVDVKQSPERLFPPRFDLLRRERPGIWPDVVTPYRHSELITFPPEPPTVTVDHADGRDDVTIEPCGPELTAFAAVLPSGDDVSEGVGMSAALSFDEAFAKALENLPPTTPPHPDALTTVTVEDIRGLFGGIAGFAHLVVRVRSSTG